MEYTREQLISICARAIVPHKEWTNRDTHSAMSQIGTAWALLWAGCKFEILHDENLRTNERTIWIKMWAKTFGWFEYSTSEEDNEGYDHDGNDPIIFYLPTEKRLSEAAGGDWY